MFCTLILSEKREAAERIARALDDSGTPKKLVEHGVPYFEAMQKNRQILVVPAIGHLYNIAPERGGRFYYPVFNILWKPTSQGSRETHVRNWIKAISSLSKEASEFISATDYDIEGEVIGYTILKYACGNKEANAKRMTFSTLTMIELRDAFQKLSSNIDFKLAEAGETRHIIDFLWGVNLSRALTLAVKNWGKGFAILSTGRVQAPTLRFLVDREKEIQSYVPTPYWEVHAKARIGGKFYEIEFEESKLDSEDMARKIVEACLGREGLVEDVDTRIFKQSPPTPFDIGTLQAEAYKLFGFTPSRTLTIAERLYLDALISYPRTSSQKFPPQINCREIIMSLQKSREYAAFASELLKKRDLKPNEGNRDDPAHPAIHPTGDLPEKIRDSSQLKIFDLIVKRFFAVFSSPAIKEGIRITIKVNENTFFLHGRRIISEGWLRFYEPYGQADEVILPTLEKEQKITITEVSSKEKYTAPPPRYNPASLLKMMDDEHLGTKATRANIIDTLYQRGYLREERMAVTELGFNVIETLEEYASGILSVDFTRNLEDKMETIEKGGGRKEEILIEAVQRLKTILEDLKNREEPIGEELGNAARRARVDESVVGICPVCKTGNLLIIHSMKTGKRFIGCSNFAKGLCNASFPLPQSPYTVKSLKRNCKVCRWPMVLVKSRKRQPWNLCLNPYCPTKEHQRRV
ncbi:MAG: topoisomerase [Thermoproteota archaeon]|nr:topoisomerase [Thermoproteota archaeon]